MDNTNIKEIEGTEVQALLMIARTLSGDGSDELAERVLKQSLKLAEESAGIDSPLLGLVLLDLVDLYERQGRHTEANMLWEWIKRILIRRI